MELVAKALIFDGSGNLLILRRSLSHPHYPHHDDFPGGLVDEGESHHMAVIREIFEETGLLVAPDAVDLVLTREYPLTAVHTIFTTTLQGIQPDIQLSWEHDKAEWLPVTTLLTKPHPHNTDIYTKTVLEYLMGIER